MRITKDRLISLAKNFVLEETFRDKHITCIFLTGSALGDQFLLNNTTDIDLVIIHRTAAKLERKTIRISHQVHYDCWTYPVSLFQDSKTLRLNPWIGSAFCGETLVLYDEGHWFDFQQAAIFSKFFEPETRYQRCKPLLDKARNDWLLLDGLEGSLEFPHVQRYVQTLENLGNLLAGLVDFPLTLRRFALELPEKASALGKPGLAAGLFDHFCPSDWQTFPWQSWQENWQTLYNQVSSLPDCPAEFQPFRMDYYLQPMELFMEESPESALWISLKTMIDGWNQLSLRNIKPELSLGMILEPLNLDQTHFKERLLQLDAYLDAVEITVEQWAEEQGTSL
jgi:hypothetical protein